jgi:hypothetical protein
MSKYKTSVARKRGKLPQIFGKLESVALIYNSALGHVGLTSGRSLTTPTVEGQKLAIEGAYAKACIGIDSVNCILLSRFFRACCRSLCSFSIFFLVKFRVVHAFCYVLEFW